MLVVGSLRRRTPLIVGAVAALAALVMLFPVTCQHTLIGFDSGPDPNGARCSTAFVRALDGVEAYHPRDTSWLHR